MFPQLLMTQSLMTRGTWYLMIPILGDTEVESENRERRGERRES